MYKYLLCIIITVMGCSSASFDIADMPDEDAGCLLDCIDSDKISTETSSSDVNPLIEADTNVVTDSIAIDTDTLDTSPADTYVPPTDTYVPPTDTGPGCIPKTCSSLLSSTGRQPCGVIPDGCGGVVSCPTVCANHKESCGGSAGFTSTTVTLATTLLPKTPYQCSGDCAYISTSTGSMCPSGKMEMWRCSNAFSFNPFSDCVGAINLMYPYTQTGPNTLWCCPSNLEIK